MKIFYTIKLLYTDSGGRLESGNRTASDDPRGRCGRLLQSVEEDVQPVFEETFAGMIISCIWDFLITCEDTR